VKLPLPRRRKTAKPKSTTSPWILFKASLIDLRLTWKPLTLVMAVILIPLNLIGLIDSVANDPVASVYAYTAIVILNNAIIWAIVRYQETGTVPRPGSAYYDGSASLLRYLISLLWLGAMLIPAVLGTVIFLAADPVVAAQGTLQEGLLIDLICVLISIPTFWMLTRFGLAPIAAVADGLRPLSALRYSRQLTLKRFWRVFIRYAAMLIFVLILALPIAAVTAGLALLKAGAFAALFFGLVTSFLILPLTYFYLLRLYRSLQAEPAKSVEKT
jgi:hypothetical protein